MLPFFLRLPQAQKCTRHGGAEAIRAHIAEQLCAKDLLKVPTRRFEVDSNLQPSGCKAPNIPLHHRAPHYEETEEIKVSEKDEQYAY